MRTGQVLLENLHPVLSSLGFRFLNNRYCLLGRKRRYLGLGIKKVYKNEAQVSFLVIVTIFLGSSSVFIMFISHFVLVWLLCLLCVALARS